MACFSDLPGECSECTIKLSLQIPLVDDEIKKAAGDTQEEDTAMVQGSVQKLVTADGTYATQSAFSTTASVKKDYNRFAPRPVVGGRMLAKWLSQQAKNTQH